MKKRIYMITLMILLLGVTAGCSNGKDENGDGKLKVITTIFSAYDFSRQIGGENADVSMLLKPGAEAHSYEPTPRDIVNIGKCDVLVCNGGENEVWLDSILEAVDNPDMIVVRMVDCCEGIAEEEKEGMQSAGGILAGLTGHEHHHGDGEDEHEHEDEHGHTHDENEHDDEAEHHGDEEHDDKAEHHEEEYDEEGHDDEAEHHGEEDHDDEAEHHGEENHDDEAEHHHEEETEWDEHVWMSPVNACLIADAVCEAYCSADSANAEYYRQNNRAYQETLKKLNEDIINTLNDGKSRTLVFADRFPARYFVEEYGLDYRAAFSGCSADTQASAATVAFIINYVKENNIGVIYTMELSDGRLADAVAEETGAVIRTFYTGHNVTLADFEAGVTYVDLLYRNLEAIR